MIDRIEKWAAERRQKAAQRALAADKAWRQANLVPGYLKRREAALRGLR